jgi:hypothetical protein
MLANNTDAGTNPTLAAKALSKIMSNLTTTDSKLSGVDESDDCDDDVCSTKDFTSNNILTSLLSTTELSMDTDTTASLKTTESQQSCTSSEAMTDSLNVIGDHMH